MEKVGGGREREGGGGRIASTVDRPARRIPRKIYSAETGVAWTWAEPVFNDSYQ